MECPGFRPARGRAFRPLRIAGDGWSELMRLEPGSTVPLHRHNGDVHAFNLSGAWEILGTGERAGPGSYLCEPAGTIETTTTHERHNPIEPERIIRMNSQVSS